MSLSRRVPVALVCVTVLMGISGWALDDWKKEYVAVAPEAFAPRDYVDNAPTQKKNPSGNLSHACPGRHALGGVELLVDKKLGNGFFCVEIGEIGKREWVRYGTNQDYNMVSCPSNKLITAINNGDGWIECGLPVVGVENRVEVKTGTTKIEKLDFRLCPGSTATTAGVVVGVRYDEGRILCGAIPRRL